MDWTETTVPAYWPTAFIGDAEYLCPGCASERWGQWKNGLNTVLDSEGNQVTAVYSWNEGDVYRCDNCDPVIARCSAGEAS